MTFDEELQLAIDNKLPENHIFSLGKPGVILLKCGFPGYQPIQMSLSHLSYKAKLERHPFELKDIFGLKEALNSPVAVFEYGDRTKSENVFVDLVRNNKHFLVGIHFKNPKLNLKVSTVRTIFPKETIEVLNWINQGKLIYGNKEKLQTLITQQQMNFADVNNKDMQNPLHIHCLESINNILSNVSDVNGFFISDYPFYNEYKEKYNIFKKFQTFYTNEGVVAPYEYATTDSNDFYNALKNQDLKIVEEYISTDDFRNVSHLARECFAEYFGLDYSMNNFSFISNLSILEEKIKSTNDLTRLSRLLIVSSDEATKVNINKFLLKNNCCNEATTKKCLKKSIEDYRETSRKLGIRGE